MKDELSQRTGRPLSPGGSADHSEGLQPRWRLPPSVIHTPARAFEGSTTTQTTNVSTGRPAGSGSVV